MFTTLLHLVYRPAIICQVHNRTLLAGSRKASIRASALSGEGKPALAHGLLAFQKNSALAVVAVPQGRQFSH